jgi:RNA polymerase sigma-70 factor (ECF subfamily)
MTNIEILYKETSPKMSRLAEKMVHDENVADDIVQEVFVYYFEKTQSGHRIDNPQSWLARATMNKCVDHLKYKEKFTSLDTANEQIAEEKFYEINKTETILKQAISKLKPLEMKIVILYSEEYSYKEISSIAKINFSSVGKTLSRTLQKLKEILKKMNYEMY